MTVRCREIERHTRIVHPFLRRGKRAPFPQCHCSHSPPCARMLPSSGAASLRCNLIRGSMSPATNKAPEAPRRGEFEKSLARLEEVVKRLESADLSLDEAMNLFEEGVKLSRECQKNLEEAEGRVEVLLKKADGKISAEPFETEDEPS